MPCASPAAIPKIEKPTVACATMGFLRVLRRQRDQLACTSSAWKPFWPLTTLKLTFWPSFRVLKPLP